MGSSIEITIAWRHIGICASRYNLMTTNQAPQDPQVRSFLRCHMCGSASLHASTLCDVLDCVRGFKESYGTGMSKGGILESSSDCWRLVVPTVSLSRGRTCPLSACTLLPDPAVNDAGALKSRRQGRSRRRNIYQNVVKKILSLGRVETGRKFLSGRALMLEEARLYGSRSRKQTWSTRAKLMS